MMRERLYKHALASHQDQFPHPPRAAGSMMCSATLMQIVIPLNRIGHSS